jgi:hypothetical protein
MSTRLYHNKRWSEEDDNLLRSMSQAGKSLTLMTVKLNRPIASIRARAEDLGLGIRDWPPQAEGLKGTIRTAQLSQ